MFYLLSNLFHGLRLELYGAFYEVIKPQNPRKAAHDTGDISSLQTILIIVNSHQICLFKGNSETVGNVALQTVELCHMWHRFQHLNGAK